MNLTRKQKIYRGTIIFFSCLCLFFSLLMSCNESSDDDGENTTDTATPTGTYTGNTPTPTGTSVNTPTATPTHSDSIEGHWIGDVYLHEYIGPCNVIELWVTQTTVTGYLYWTVGTGDPELNADCNSDINGNPITWIRKDFSTDLNGMNFEWTDGSLVPPESVVGVFYPGANAVGVWIHHPDQDNYNFGEWSAAKVSD